MRKIQVNIRLSTAQIYEIEKIAKYFNTTPSAVIRYSIDDYIDVFRVWQGRLCSGNYPLSSESTLEYDPGIK